MAEDQGDPTPTYGPVARTPKHTEKVTTIRVVQQGGAAGFAYFLGLIGAAVYYIQAAASFWGGVVGVLKALVWPAFLVYELFRLAAAA